MKTTKWIPFALALSAGVSCTSAVGPADDEAELRDLLGLDSSGKADDASAVPLQYNSYKVLFTNPQCADYEYNEEVMSVDGEVIESKPKNVFCTTSDAAASGARESSPQHQIIEWVRPLQAGDEIFLAYLSFSSAAVGNELCAAAERGVTVNFVLDANTTQSDRLKQCGGNVILRGHQGGIGYAHNKIIAINPNGPGPSDAANPDFMRMTFGSGNMSSGTVLHHENWHFLEVKRDTFFAGAHQCLVNAQLSDEATASKAAFTTFMDTCRADIAFPRETDIIPFFVPAKTDSRLVQKLLVSGIASAESVDLGSHRFAYSGMINGLVQRLESDPSFNVRLVADDDLYWLHPVNGVEGIKVGDNMEFESYNVHRLDVAGGNRFEVRYMQTNDEQHLLFHNKFLIYKNIPEQGDAVLCGAANLTGAGFRENFENVYWVRIPEVIEQFNTQFARFWDGRKASADEPTPPMATRIGDMPAMHSNAVTRTVSATPPAPAANP